MPDPALVAQLSAAAEHLAAGRFAEARAATAALLAAHPDDPDVLHIAGLAAFRAGDAEAAIDHLTRSLELQPESGDVLANFGQIQFELGNHEAAEGCFAAALDLAPDDYVLRLRYALTLQQLERYKEAEGELRRVLRTQPADVPALYNLGLALAAQQRTQEAIAAYDQAAAINPLEFSARTRAASLRLDICQWDTIGRMRQEIVEAALRAPDSPRPPLPHELLRLPVPIAPAELRTLAVSFARAHRLIATPRFSFPAPQPLGPGRRLRIGYVSSDFGDHPVGHIVSALFPRHDRGQFEVFAYALSPDDRTSERQQIARAVNGFIDISKAPAADAAQRIHADRIDVLVDLNGHTRGNRAELFAFRPAPVQATWLGFAGTTGVDFFDYLIGDARIAPASEQPYFTERLVQLPETYFAVEPTVADVTPSRQALGLPANGVVLCAFTLSHKIEPIGFGAWMRLLQRISGSVLWLRIDHPAAIENLKREAAARGVDPRRLIFAPRVATRADHLRRQRAADLMLDTLFYNGHSTTAESLAAGVPLVTMRGRRLAARVGADLLETVGLPDLIANSPEEYEAIALRIASDAQAIAEAKRRLAAAHATSPLFDVGRFARHLEAAYKAMWENHTAGRAPQPLAIPALPR